MNDIKKEKIKEPYKKIIMNIRNAEYTVNLYYRKGKGETYKDKVMKLIKGQTKKYKFIKEILFMILINLSKWLI